MSAVGQATPDDGLVKAIYRDGNGDPEPDPEAVPAVLPETEGDADVRSVGMFWLRSFSSASIRGSSRRASTCLAAEKRSCSGEQGLRR